MPTYSYACTSCGHAFDIRQSFTEDSLTVCPECTVNALRKVIHPVGIAFKGSGFYKTDSRASGPKGAPASVPGSDGSGSDGSGSNASGSNASGSNGSTSSDSGVTPSSGTSGGSPNAPASRPAASTASSTAS